MKALVLGAGRGSRLSAYTEDRPKCLIEINGTSLLARQTAALRAAGPDLIGVVAGWHGERLAGRGLTMFRNERWRTSTMVESLASAHRWLTSDVTLVSYGDIVYTADPVLRLASVDAPIAVAFDPNWRSLWQRRFDDPLADAETFQIDDAGRVTDIGGRPSNLSEVRGQYMGLVKLTPGGWAELDRVRTAGMDMTALLRRVVRDSRMPVVGVENPDPWCEFDHERDLEVGLPIVREIDRKLFGH
jgi:L-glutamine-phosphate cytidylyltransferase